MSCENVKYLQEQLQKHQLSESSNLYKLHHSYEKIYGISANAAKSILCKNKMSKEKYNHDGKKHFRDYLSLFKILLTEEYK